jgi:hypothetical protein
MCHPGEQSSSDSVRLGQRALWNRRSHWEYPCRSSKCVQSQHLLLCHLGVGIPIRLPSGRTGKVCTQITFIWTIASRLLVSYTLGLAKICYLAYVRSGYENIVSREGMWDTWGVIFLNWGVLAKNTLLRKNYPILPRILCFLPDCR